MAKTDRTVRLRLRRKAHVRQHVNGSAVRPRLNVYRSNAHIYAQIINDDTGQTLVSASTRSPEIVAAAEGLKKCEVAKKVGQLVAQRATAAGVTAVAFDRNGFKYHGRVAALAEGAREGGLAF